jgi:hypothetical protein
LFTSVTDKACRRALGACLAYLAAALFCLVFGAVYEHFSHGVYSNAMVYAFAYPLCLGVLPFFAACAFGGERTERIVPSGASAHLWAYGVATLTVGSILSGVLEIYGTDSDLLIVYPIAGAVLLWAAIVKTLCVFTVKSDSVG